MNLLKIILKGLLGLQEEGELKLTKGTHELFIHTRRGINDLYISFGNNVLPTCENEDDVDMIFAEPLSRHIFVVKAVIVSEQRTIKWKING